ncbi:SusC/RagA family TonB-linked outer membrane protein [Zobellia galactanivorans]|uniref:SusC/RagA family TonB-linked outer membrane protein n=1 Tax=Zobellia galactanivorans (strain DSM 12802 / CCUG 47099 / CIP 106680 / NCIMB 13871 / Dsij) TaxID=63186 RepID=UPI001C06F670|nr:TonB-dependent receptor [Zobellia galactanivorans]MBU3024167.1 TonB-dependent receptor [Zobellia galactanivorans]
MKKEKQIKSWVRLCGVTLVFLFGTIGIMAQTVTGTVTSIDGPLIGASIVEKGTVNGSQTDFDGNFAINLSGASTTLVISYIGFSTKEVSVAGKESIIVELEEDAASLEEVVVVGYGTKKKVNLTGAISVLDEEVLEARPVANAQQALQGASPGLQITQSGATGEPGADMNMNIRGLTSLEGNSSPYILVDNIPMGINDIDPSDIASISVLKDVAASAIYGARAAYGVVLITTKSGKSNKGVNVSYSTNYAITSMLNMPQNADALSFAHTMNHASINAGGSGYYDDAALARIEQNMASPGSAPEVLATPNGLSWDLGVDGLNASAATDWESIFFNKSGSRMKHNLNITGGSENLSFYLSGGLYEEDGLLKQGDDSFNRYNIDAKISAKLAPWADLSFLAKYKYEEEEYPEQVSGGRSFIMLLMTRLKPTKPAYYPGTEVWTGRVGEQELHRSYNKERQIILSPRLTLKPFKNWTTNIELNYKTNDNRLTSEFPTIASAVPDGSGGSIITSSSQENTGYNSTMYSNTYLSPNIYTEYTRSLGKHNFLVLGGYQQETYRYFNLYASAKYLLTDAIPSINTAVGEKTIFDGKGHWSTQGFFGRFSYNFDEKYLFEMNLRRDGSSRFDEDNRWGTFPSVSAGWVVSKENFYPFKEQIEFLKFRGSYGSIGNQDVDNYLYVPTMPISESGWLFGGERLWTVGTPNLSSVDLTWEKVSTLDFGLDLRALNNRLGFTFDWYQSKTSDLVGPGQAVPAILGTSVPKTNGGEVTTTGWEVELSWQNSSKDFSYGFRGVLSDYQSEITSYNNPTKILSNYYEGQMLNEIWGLETAGLFQSDEDVANWGVDQSFLYSGAFLPGDVKYVDQTGDGAIDIGDNTKDNPGDRKIIGNSTPRYQFGFSANASYKGFDFSFLIQGVGKRDLDLRGLGTFRGPANGPLHANVYEEHLDFWRDDTSPLGANPDAYFANPYSQFTGQNNKNYGYATTRYLQNGAYARLKNMQIGYTLPRGTGKKKLPKTRIYISGENLLTFTDLMIYDPEAFNGRNSRVGDQYPLSQVYSLGLNINF